MRRILMALVVVALLVAGCSGDDDDAGGSDDGAAGTIDDDANASSGSDGDGDEPTGADGAELPDTFSTDPDGDLADFPIPSPAGATDAVVTEVDGQQVAEVTYPTDRYDEIVDAYETWLLDNGVIATAPDRSSGIVAMGGANESGDYLVTIITDGDQILVQLVAG